MVCSLSSHIKNSATSVRIKKNSINGLKKDSEVLPFQLRTISEKRLVKKIGEISQQELAQILINIQHLMIL